MNVTPDRGPSFVLTTEPSVPVTGVMSEAQKPLSIALSAKGLAADGELVLVAPADTLEHGDVLGGGSLIRADAGS